MGMYTPLTYYLFLFLLLFSLPIQTLLAQFTQQKGDPPPEALVRISSIIQKLHQTSSSRNSSRNLETPKALCGRVANVLIWEQSHWNLITENVPIGCFVRLRNVDVNQWKNNDFRCKYRLVCWDHNHTILCADCTRSIDFLTFYP
jgi:hypothetical protein